MIESKQTWIPSDTLRKQLRKDLQTPFAERLIVCTDGCASIQNPAAVAGCVAALREAVLLMANWPNMPRTNPVLERTLAALAALDAKGDQ